MQTVPVQTALWRLDDPVPAECLGQGMIFDNYYSSVSIAIPPCLSVGAINVDLRRVNGAGDTLDVTDVLGLSLDVEFYRPSNISKYTQPKTQQVQCLVSYPVDELSPGLYSNCYIYTPGSGDVGSPTGIAYLVCTVTLTPINNVNNTHGYGIYSSKIIFKPIGKNGDIFNIEASCGIVQTSQQSCTDIQDATSTLPITMTDTSNKCVGGQTRKCCDTSFTINFEEDPLLAIDPSGGDVYACAVDESGDLQNLCSLVGALENS